MKERLNGIEKGYKQKKKRKKYNKRKQIKK